MIEPAERIIVALDRPDLSSALQLAEAVRPYVGAFKVGLELFTAEGPPAVRQICALGGRVFLDGKFHDIPNTAAGACRAGVRTGAWMLNVHAAGGREMLKAAAAAVREEGRNRPGEEPILLGVTVLTSLNRPLLAEVLGSDVDPADHVLRLAVLCQECGLHGVV
ncbi:MAG: orotidine-5'-phosphate decarboxylase, partial [Armatimonadota bacterium]|nr:orotidine-5'-phosphate decarboxylase [Armatimonadota bacterium]